MLKGEASAISERRGSILPRATLVTFAFFHLCVTLVKSYNLSPALAARTDLTKRAFQPRAFKCPILPLNCAEKPHCDVVTGKGRYFRAPLSFIWMPSSSLVLQERWQHKTLMPTLEMKPCRCQRPTKERRILNRFIRISLLRQQIVTLPWQMASWERLHQNFCSATAQFI